MKLFITKLALLSALAASSQAWELTFQGEDSAHILKLNGRADVKCNTIDEGKRFIVRSIDFDKNNPWPIPDAHSFRVWSGPDCSAGSVHKYDSGDGYHPLATPFKIKSYSID